MSWFKPTAITPHASLRCFLTLIFSLRWAQSQESKVGPEKPVSNIQKLLVSLHSGIKANQTKSVPKMDREVLHSSVSLYSSLMEQMCRLLWFVYFETQRGVSSEVVHNTGCEHTRGRGCVES